MASQGQSCGFSGQQDQHKQQDMEIRERLSHIKNKILVMSGKGGVGKSSVAAYLAVVLARRGFRVGLMDVDLHGPSIPRLLGLKGTIRPGNRESKAKPIEYLPNMEVISIEPLMGEDKDQATIWRGPLKIGVIRQFIADIEWSDLDYLIVDSPPGTGDEPLTVAQTIPDAEALIVTTPQEISLADVRKSIHFCRQVNMKILGLVENMSGLVCPHCGKVIDLFKTGGGMITAKKESVRLLGSLPLEPTVVRNGDIGNMDLLDKDGLAFTRSFNEIVDKIIEVGKAKVSFPMTGGDLTGRPEKKDADGQKTLVIPVSAGKLSPHFGHCEQFAFIETEKGEIKAHEMKTPPAHEPGVLPRWLYEQGADVVITGGMGEQAQQLLREKGVEVILGAPMDSPEAIAHQFLSGSLVTGNNACDH
jgi:Mrp family chromosome partitioning ATPase/predicted Fe-Mo cluster-binding NifX family protein